MANVDSDIKKIAENADQKRTALWILAERKLRWERRLRILSGIMALVSGASITTLFGKFTNELLTQIFSAVVALLAGILTLVASIHFDIREIVRMYEAMSKFQKIRNSAILIVRSMDGNQPPPSKVIEDLMKEYGDLSAASDQFLPPGFIESLKISPSNIKWA